eukprot:765643-Hanusia_phi.AAC.2
MSLERAGSTGYWIISWPESNDHFASSSEKQFCTTEICQTAFCVDSTEDPKLMPEENTTSQLRK